jgi:hypothetical protein
VVLSGFFISSQVVVQEGINKLIEKEKRKTTLSAIFSAIEEKISDFLSIWQCVKQLSVEREIHNFRE